MSNTDWVDVNQELPPSDDWVLVFDGLYVAVGFHLEDVFSVPDEFNMEHHEVTHWMPLPAPPEAKR